MDQHTANLIHTLAFAAQCVPGTEAAASLHKKIEELVNGKPQELSAIERTAYKTSVENCAIFRHQLSRLGDLDQAAATRFLTEAETEEFRSILRAWHRTETVAIEPE